ncbi:MAG TPA: hypothetical protein PLB12_01005 [Candidatus Goldiibacteriota bacterium]|nr:hypothetical protein [Candidatus Goldiibacteriota bacterium]HRQ42912.1 hypothetical protein [Candidatus Goldiibacteriota bacterium]
MDESLFIKKAAAIKAASGGHNGAVVSAAYVKTLPAPVKKFAAFLEITGKPMIDSAEINHTGEFKPSQDGQWFKIKGKYFLTGKKPSFVWRGVINMAPFVTMGATDSYFNGSGRMHIKLMSLFTLQDAAGGYMNQASLERMLTECLLIPTVLFDKNIITWEKAGADSAYASIKDSGMTSRALLAFNPDGSLKSIKLKRNREEGKVLVSREWAGYPGEFKDYNGYKLPSYMEGAWIADGKEQLYVKFKTDNAVYYPAADATNKEAQAH